MPYPIASDWPIDLLADDPTALVLLDRPAPGGLNMSAIGYVEAFQATPREPDPEASAAKLTLVVAPIPVLPCPQPVAHRCARIREARRHTGRRVGSYAFDLAIAATAVAHDLTLVPPNRDDDRDPPGPRLFETPSA